MRTTDRPPRVSVILCVFNGVRHVSRAIESILRQSYGNLELIVVDDGSTDETPSILARYSDPRLRVVRQSNVGLTRSLNRGIDLARGEFLARQDADDVSMPQRLEKQVELLDDNPETGFSGTWVHLIDEQDRVFGDVQYAVDDDRIRAAHLQENQFAHGSLLLRKSLVKRVGGYRPEFRFAQDYDLTLRLLEITQAANVPRCLYLLRHTADKLSYIHAREQLVCAVAARELAQCRNAGQDETTPPGELIDAFLPASGLPRCSYEDEVIYQALKCGYPKVARSYLRRQLRAGQRPIRNSLRLALAMCAGSTSRYVYAIADRMRGYGRTGGQRLRF